MKHLTEARGRYSITTSITLCSKELHNSYIVKDSEKATCEHCLAAHKELTNTNRSK